MSIVIYYLWVKNVSLVMPSLMACNIPMYKEPGPNLYFFFSKIQDLWQMLLLVLLSPFVLPLLLLLLFLMLVLLLLPIFLECLL